MPTYKDEKRGTFYCSFYYVDWTGARKRKKKEGFKLERDAKAFERDFLTKQQSNCDMPFGSLVALYLDDSETRVRSTTLANKKNMINLKILPFFEKINVNKITPNHIRNWQNDLKKQGYAFTYLKTISNQLTAIFNFAIKYYNLSTSPALKAGSMGKKNAESMKFWTVEEFKSFLEFSDKPIATLAFKVLFWSGIRRGELLALTFNDIDLENNLINVNKTFTILAGKDIINSPKTPKSKRVISISQNLSNDIKIYIDSLYSYKSSDRIFALSLSYLSREITRICKISEVKPIRVHDLRHSHASLLIELGFSPILISERLGHEKIQTTLDTYSHLYPNKDNLVANKLNDLY